MVILHEILKLLHYSGAQDVKFFRIGTSGGLGICFGSTVIINNNLLVRRWQE